MTFSKFQAEEHFLGLLTNFKPFFKFYEVRQKSKIDAPKLEISEIDSEVTTICKKGYFLSKPKVFSRS